MKYILSIEPGKEEPFFQLLQSLQELGILEEFTIFDELSSRPADFSSGTKPQEPHSYDLAEQYRDLVD